MHIQEKVNPLDITVVNWRRLTTMPSVTSVEVMGFKLVDWVLSTTMELISDTGVIELMCVGDTDGYCVGDSTPSATMEKILAGEATFTCSSQSYRNAVDMGPGACERGR